LALSAKSLNLNFWTTGAGTPKNHAGRLEARELFQPAFDLKGTTSMARKNLAAAALLSAGVLLLSGCATGFDAATSNQGNSGNGRSADVGAIQIRNATVVVDPADSSRAAVLMTIINTDAAADDVLNGIATADSVELAGEVNIALPNKDVVNVGFDSENRIGIPIIVLTSVTGALEPGTYVNLSFQFASGQSAPMSLLINENSGIYSDIEIPVPTAP
jgi:hypothetical protein